MNIAITGATGFLGRYIVARLTGSGHTCRCWYRPTSDRTGLESCGGLINWVPGGLGDQNAARAITEGCQALVHAALDYPRSSGRMSGREFNLEVARRNIEGSLSLFEMARRGGVERIVFISSCAVYERILDDRPLDETHPLWPASHYGAHKAAIEAFVCGYGLGEGYPLCALRPTGIYGLAHPAGHSKWYDLVGAVVRGEPVNCQSGGKEVHAADVAQAVEILLEAENVAGEAYNCYDRYVSQYEVAALTKAITASPSQIHGALTAPKHQIETGKIRDLGMKFGGSALFETTIRQLVAAIGAA